MTGSLQPLRPSPSGWNEAARQVASISAERVEIGGYAMWQPHESSPIRGQPAPRERGAMFQPAKNGTRRLTAEWRGQVPGHRLWVFDEVGRDYALEQGRFGHGTAIHHGSEDRGDDVGFDEIDALLDDILETAQRWVGSLMPYT